MGKDMIELNIDLLEKEIWPYRTGKKASDSCLKLNILSIGSRAGVGGVHRGGLFGGKKCHFNV